MLEALLEKYSEMLRMRERDGRDDGHDPRAEMAALARRFPGALREIDERPLEQIRSRIGQLQDARAGRGEVPPWAPLQASYHGVMRAFLRVRPLLRDRSSSQARAAITEGYEQMSPDEPTLEALLGPVFTQLCSPPNGRLNGVVFGYVARLHGVSAAQVSDALFKPGRQRPNDD